MTIEYKYAATFSATTLAWNTHSGTTPYINDSTDAISAYTQNALDSYFTVDPTAITDFSYISAAIIQVEEKDNNEIVGVKVELSVNGGSSWWTAITAGGFYGDATYRYIDSTSILGTGKVTSLAELNALWMRMTKLGSSSGTTTIRRYRTKVTWSAPSGGNPNSVQIMAHRREPKLKPRAFPKFEPHKINVPLLRPRSF